MPFRNALEPASLAESFLAEPPLDFTAARTARGIPWFDAPFDLLTTADDALRARVARLPGQRWWSRALRWRTSFVGTTVSEYALFPEGALDDALPTALRAELGHRRRLTIIKDIPQQSPLLDAASNAAADALIAAAREAGFVVLQGQALAWLPIDFGSVEEYLSRLSSARRKDLRRKLRSRDRLQIQTLATGAPCFADPAVLAEFQALFDNVYAQSQIHFDRPTPAFFRRVFNDASAAGIVFTYRLEGRLIGWNLCYAIGGRLVDKYIGLRYPEARERNLYFVSWVRNLEYALEHGLTAYVAGWTDPEVKASLGARFTFTRHAVYARNPVLRALLRRLAGSFEGDRALLEERHAP